LPDDQLMRPILTLVLVAPGLHATGAAVELGLAGTVVAAAATVVVAAELELLLLLLLHAVAASAAAASTASDLAREKPM
jgi:hypothetical protein